ncbi:MAG: peptidase A1 pepsin [Gammaproteobacteria bacterium]|nr:peptidase A1 pepsin [Gammaproteobacteria bacterium]
MFKIGTYNAIEKALIVPLQRDRLTGNGATPWWGAATVGISERPQVFKFMFDTGTRYTWVTSIKCVTTACDLHDKYNPLISTSFSSVDKEPVKLDFGAWGTLIATLGNDIFFNTEHDNEGLFTNFYLGEKYKGLQWEELVQDGFIACGPTQNGSTSDLFFKKLWDAGLLSEPVISYYGDFTIDGSASDSGEVRFGDTNPNRYDKDTLVILPHNQSSTLNYFWVSDCRDITVNGVSITGGFEAMIDTGASTINGDPQKIQDLVEAVTLNGTLPISPDDPDNYDYPDLIIEIGTFEKDGSNASFVLTPKDYFQYIEAEAGEGVWYLGLVEMEGYEGRLNLGAIFLNRYHTIWEYDTSIPGLQGKALHLAEKITTPLGTVIE